MKKSKAHPPRLPIGLNFLPPANKRPIIIRAAQKYGQPAAAAPKHSLIIGRY
jgi:hypothetical protein